MKTSEILSVARRFNAGNARRNTIRIWEQARLMDTPAAHRACEAGAACLREAGIRDVSIEKLPTDGRTSVNGWMMPVAWSVREARLEAASGARLVLADYAVNPQNIALYSPGTQGGRWVEGGVVVTKDPRTASVPLRGRFILIEEGNGSLDINEFAARRGALAVLTVCDRPLPNAARYLNYSVPLDATRACIPCFSLTPDCAKQLRERLAATPALRLRARVRATRGEGSMPLLTGVVGSGGPEIFVTGHIDEIGAQDNASGCGTAIEALRVLQALSRSKRAAPQRRAIRFFFSVEVRGVQAWLARQKRLPDFIGGINLDMVAAKPDGQAGLMNVLTGFRHRPHFCAHLIREARALADREVGVMAAQERHNYVSDGVLGIYKPGGYVSLEQKAGPTYHSSADTPDTLNLRSLRWTGLAATTFLYRLSRLDHADALALAKGIHRQAVGEARSRKPEAQVELARAAAELRSLQEAITIPDLYPRLNGPADVYRAGVRRSTGCWPAVEQRAGLDALCSDLARRASRRALPGPMACSSAAVRWEAEALVPLALERGYLSFEDHITAGSRRALKDRLNMEPGWSANSWAWFMVTGFNGKSTVADIVDDLARVGVNVDPAQAVALTRYLVDIGRARLRPVLDGRDIRLALREVGVRRGSILMTHASLSGFGYVKGGAGTVVDALRDVLGPRGTLLMAAHSNSVLGAQPYWPATSRSNVGAVTEYFRKLPGVLRSAHPTHSVAGIGPAAAEVLGAATPEQSPMARDGFWGKLYDLGGDVLLLCPIHSCTIFHVGETWNGLLQPTLTFHWLDRKGRRHVNTVPNAPWHSDHFEPTMAKPLIRRGVMREAQLGEGTIRLAPARAMADISCEVNRRNPLVSLGKNGACTCFYCDIVRAGVVQDSSGNRVHFGVRSAMARRSVIHNLDAGRKTSAEPSPQPPPSEGEKKGP